MTHERVIHRRADLDGQAFQGGRFREEFVDEGDHQGPRARRRMHVHEMDGHRVVVHGGREWQPDQQPHRHGRRRWQPDHLSHSEDPGEEHGMPRGRRRFLSQHDQEQFFPRQRQMPHEGMVPRQLMRFFQNGSASVMLGGQRQFEDEWQDSPRMRHQRFPNDFEEERFYQRQRTRARILQQQWGDQWQQDQWTCQPPGRGPWGRQTPWGNQGWGNQGWGRDWNGHNRGGLTIDLGPFSISLGGRGGPQIYMGGGNFHPRNFHGPRQREYCPSEMSGRWSIDPETGERYMTGMSPRQYRIMQRASGGDPRFFNRPRIRQSEINIEVDLPNRRQRGFYERENRGFVERGEREPGYTEPDVPFRPPHTYPSESGNRDNYNLHGSPEGQPNPEREVRRRPNKEPRPTDRTARRPRQGDDAPTDPESFRRMEHIARSMEGHVITEYDRTIPPDLGCAKAVSLLVAKTYNLPIHDATTVGLELSLERNGFERVPWEERRAGDVMVAHRDAGKKSHAAVYFGEGRIYNNSSPKGYITTESEAKLYNPEYKQIIVYRKVR